VKNSQIKGDGVVIKFQTLDKWRNTITSLSQASTFGDLFFFLYYFSHLQVAQPSFNFPFSDSSPHKKRW
jgi:hypothetical protein